MTHHLMRNLVLLCAALAMRSLAQETPAATEEFSVNGLKVILRPNTANAIVSVQFYLRGGVLNLNEGNQGIERLIFQSALKGSQKYPKDKLNATLDRTAGTINSFSTKDYTSIALRCVASDFDELWDLYADVIMHPTFGADDVELVRQNILLSLKQRTDNPDAYLNDLAESVFFAGHPYRLKPEGLESTIPLLTVEQMKRYLQENLVTSKLLLVVVGDVSRSDLEAKVARTLGTLPRGSYTSTLPPAVLHNEPSLQVTEKALPTNYITGYFSAPAPRDADYYAMLVTLNILRTRLFEEVRTKRNLSYAPGAGAVDQLANHGFIYVTAVSPDTTIKVMREEMRKLREVPVEASDLRERVALFITSYNLRSESDAAQGQFLALFELSGLGWRAQEKFIENIRRVTVQDVMRVADADFKNLQYVVLGDPKKIDRSAFGL
ncbi:MAG TPA: pitrilysin family protein [Bacteroidota bacterium]|nr:pitrilysin family protein [Bacteroidota bacterium]